MLTYLSDHAFKHVWCAPKQDTQGILLPKRISPPHGVWNYIQIAWDLETLPESNKRFHVYHIGQLQPELLGLFDTKDEWVSLSQAMEIENMIIELYTVNGVMIPRFTAWYKWTDERNLILAVRENESVPWDMLNESLYFRVYSGSYFNLLRKDRVITPIAAHGQVIAENVDKAKINDYYLAQRGKPGHTFVWVNGWLRDILDVSKLTIGDVVEIVHDSTVFKKVSLPLRSLRTFDSVLDEKGKYLITYDYQGKEQIEYFDDIDFYLSRKFPQDIANNKAAYYHRNQVDAVRQVTHRDYALCVPYVLGLKNANAFFSVDFSDVYIDLYIRLSGYQRDLVYVHHRIKELYRLPYPQRVNAMLGVRSNVDVWRAEQLESSGYVKLMGSLDLDESDETIVDAYGYNATSQILGYSPILAKDFDHQTIVSRVKLPYAMRYLSGVYEHDDLGRLLTWGNHREGCHYSLRDDKTKLVELISGNGTDFIDDHYNKTHVSVEPIHEYRVYRCPKGNELRVDQWEDVTGTGLYEVTDGKIVWLVDNEHHTTLVRTDRTHLSYSLELKPNAGVFHFTLVQKALMGNQLNYVKMMVPMGHLDLYLNGRALIEGIDYIVKFPEVVILNKAYLEEPYRSGQKQRIHVRFSGFCQSDLSRLPRRQVGYIKDRMLSRNGHYDVKDDKVLRIVANGWVMDRSVLGFSEDKSLIKVPNQVREGTPYEIRDIIVPFRGIGNKDTYRFRAEAETVDRTVEDYLTQFIADVPVVHPSLPPVSSASGLPIQRQYPLYSPFMARMLDLAKHNENVLGSDATLGLDLTRHYDDNQVLSACQASEWLLDYDPIKAAGHHVDLHYCIVHPHPEWQVLDVTPYVYKFLEAVNRLYYDGKIVLNHSLRLSV